MIHSAKSHLTVKLTQEESNMCRKRESGVLLSRYAATPSRSW